MKSIFTAILLFMFYFINGQNLILNSSFSEVSGPLDSTKWYHINFKGQSDVLEWYIPNYFNDGFSSANSMCTYFTSRHVKHHINNRIFTNAEELFNHNLGFVRIYTQYCMQGTGVLQQQFHTTLKKGTYCFKFKYKRIQNQNVSGDEIDFSFSQTDLRKNYFNGNCLNLPDSMINYSFNDSISDNIDVPWQQVCTVINLKGNEEFLTIGSLRFKHGRTERQNKFFLDDIELIPLTNSNDVCMAEPTDKDIRHLSNRKFPLNKIITPLLVFSPTSKYS